MSDRYGEDNFVPVKDPIPFFVGKHRILIIKGLPLSVNIMSVAKNLIPFLL
jgi:hypothetical protein